jgi:hypothetical protein
MWEVSLISALEDEDEAEGPNEESGKHSSWLKNSLDTVTNAVSQNPTVVFLSRLQEPFVAQLLMNRNPKAPYERIGTTERLIAKPSSGALNFRGIKTLIVR